MKQPESVEQVRLPQFSSRILQQFEVVFLLPTEKLSFEDLFASRNFTEPNPVYQSWLALKRASLPMAEVMAMQAVLTLHTPTGLAKRKGKRRGTNLPSGVARHNPISPEWQVILEEREMKKRLHRKREAGK